MSQGLQYAARIEGFSIRIKDNKPPYVIINFVYSDEGQERRINYIGSLSPAAYPYTLERLQTIGYQGKLKSYEEINEWIQGEAYIQIENLTIIIDDEEYNGKTYKKVKWFFGTPTPLTDDEKEALTAKVFNFMNPKTQAPQAPAKPKAQAPAKPKPPQQAAAQNPADLFDETEQVGDVKIPF